MKYKTFQKGAAPNKLEYPVTREQVRGLKKCSLASPRHGKSHGVPMPAALCNEYTRADALKEVIEVRQSIKDGKFPRAFMEKYYPEDWGKFPADIPALLEAEGLSFDEPVGLADVVHMDNPLDLGGAMLTWLINQGAKPKGESERYHDFLMFVPGAMSEMAGDVDTALGVAFDIKYYYGVPRPEEVAGENITHYDEGCPTHPSFPAGHGAAAFASAVFFLREWVLTDEQKKALFDAAYIWSMARTFAGVHYAVDNVVFAPRRAEFD